jgi:hypothetical protein
MDKLVSDAELIVRVDRVLKRPDNFVIGDVLGLFEDLRAALTTPRPLEVGEGRRTMGDWADQLTEKALDV